VQGASLCPNKELPEKSLPLYLSESIVIIFLVVCALLPLIEPFPQRIANKDFHRRRRE